MMDDFDKWWNQERDACYWSLRYPLVYCCLLNFIARVYSTRYSEDYSFSDWTSFFGAVGLLILTPFFIWAEKTAPKYKYIASIILCEISTIAFYNYGAYLLPEHRDAILIGSMVTTFKFEISQVKSIWVTVIIQLRFLYIWYIRKLINKEINPPSIPTPYLTMLYTIFSITLYEYYERKRAFDMYRVYLSEKASNQKLEAIIKSIPEALIVINSEQNIVFHNQNSRDMFRSRSVEDLESIIKHFAYDEGRRRYPSDNTEMTFIGDLQHYIRNIDMQTNIQFGITKMGDAYFNIYGNKVLWEDKQAVIITARDISAIIRLERSEAELKLKSNMLRSVFHELKSPATGITAFTSQILEEETQFSDKGKEKLTMLKLCSNMLIYLLNDLQDYAQIISGTFSLNCKLFKLRSLLESSLQMISLQCSKRNIRCRLIYDKLLPETVYTDPERLSQVLNSLLNNALKYTMRGQIKMICQYTLDDTLRITISDTGIGLPAEDIPQLFDPVENFGNPDISTQSCGLGLHICNLLAKLLGGGGIVVTSKLFIGSSYIFEVKIHEFERTELNSFISIESSLVDIPLERDFTKYVNSMDITANSIDKLPNILVVDDSKFIHEVIGTFFRKVGMRYDSAYTGKQAVDKVNSRDKTGIQYKVIVMDCDMPEMDGCTASKEIKQLWEIGKLETMPNIIAHTTIINDEDTLKCFRSGMIDFIPKPTSEKGFMKKIKQYL
jgi:signal transduction histidine kinase/CheY-like chemotaxis protein